jgi:hypothetical protein
MTDRELDTGMYHEIGEVEATALLGERWHEMLRGLRGTPAEIMARSVRDFLADSLSTIPRLVERGDDASLHFFIGSLTNMRKEIHPGLLKAYEQWMESGDLEPFAALAVVGRGHWLDISQRMTELHRQQGASAAVAIGDLLDETRL